MILLEIWVSRRKKEREEGKSVKKNRKKKEKKKENELIILIHFLLEIINMELLLADLQTVDKIFNDLSKKVIIVYHQNFESN